MRASTCLVCRSAPVDATVATIAEALRPDLHHHHLMTCLECGGVWFEDVTLGGLGIPVPSRRDTVLCGCPEDGREIYQPSVMLVPVPESRCRCGAAELAARVTARP